MAFGNLGKQAQIQKQNQQGQGIGPSAPWMQNMAQGGADFASGMMGPGMMNRGMPMIRRPMPMMKSPQMMGMIGQMPPPQMGNAFGGIMRPQVQPQRAYDQPPVQAPLPDNPQAVQDAQNQQNAMMDSGTGMGISSAYQGGGIGPNPMMMQNLMRRFGGFQPRQWNVG